MMKLKHLAILLFLPLLAACTASPQRPAIAPAPPVTASSPLDPATLGWRTCFFKHHWPEGQPPRMDRDLLIAHRYLGPVLAEHEPHLPYWRFHRRAARDEAGHLFRFHFYTDTAHAAALITRIQQDPLRAQLIEAGVLLSVDCLAANDLSNPAIGDTSDPAWPDTIKDNWPAYIQGVSRLWLGLIDDAIKETGPPANEMNGMIEQYKQADETVNSLWHVEGEHALLHHLNAIFGYQPLHITF